MMMNVYYSGSDKQRHGVGFMVNKNIAHNVTNFRGLSDRVAELIVCIKQMLSAEVCRGIPTQQQLPWRRDREDMQKQHYHKQQSTLQYCD